MMDPEDPAEYSKYKSPAIHLIVSVYNGTLPVIVLAYLSSYPYAPLLPITSEPTDKFSGMLV
jgi:hypothetical protein